jgi:hypothetical protein
VRCMLREGEGGFGLSETGSWRGPLARRTMRLLDIIETQRNCRRTAKLWFKPWQLEAARAAFPALKHHASSAQAQFLGLVSGCPAVQDG